jgi:DUF1009 family protein
LQHNIKPKLGIIAGGGDIPALLVQACKSQGRSFHVIGLKDQADADKLPSDNIQWFRLGAAGDIITALKAAEVQQIVMIGHVRRPSVLDLRPDWYALKFFGRVGLKALGDDGLLSRVVALIEDEGFEVVGAHDVLESLLAPAGHIAGPCPNAQNTADITHGIDIAKGLGMLDVGQSVAIQQGIVLAVEAIEGTDAMIARAGQLARSGDRPVLVKLKKPQQEKRVDLPTIGTQTIINAHAAGFAGIAVHAGHAMIVDLDAVVQQAQAAGIFVVGVAPPEDHIKTP